MWNVKLSWVLYDFIYMYVSIVRTPFFILCNISQGRKATYGQRWPNFVTWIQLCHFLARSFDEIIETISCKAILRAYIKWIVIVWYFHDWKCNPAWLYMKWCRCLSNDGGSKRLILIKLPISNCLKNYLFMYWCLDTIQD